MEQQKYCPRCYRLAWTYRLATPRDQRLSALGMAVICTGAEHFAEHGCINDHAPLDRNAGQTTPDDNVFGKQGEKIMEKSTWQRFDEAEHVAKAVYALAMAKDLLAYCTACEAANAVFDHEVAPYTAAFEEATKGTSFDDDAFSEAHILAMHVMDKAIGPASERRDDAINMAGEVLIRACQKPRAAYRAAIEAVVGEGNYVGTL